MSALTFQVGIAGTDQVFPCAQEETVLDAALRAGIELPYSCRKGVCGNCTGRVTSGRVASGPADADGTAAQGELLFCQCRPLSDLVITPSSWRKVDPDARKRFKVKVFRNTPVAGDVNVLHLRLPTGQRVRFKAGQYLQVSLADGSRRSYSMANAPHESDTLQLHIRHVPGGQFTRVVTQLQPGDLLDVELPFGQVELGEGIATPLLCVVGGTGFAPAKSLIDDLVKKKSVRPVTLVWGARNREGLYLLDATSRWERVLPGFRFLPAVEHEADALALKGFHGRADQAVLAGFPTLDGHEVYCCGAPAMVQAVRSVCVERLGLPAANFFSDVFVPGPAA